MSLRLVLAVSAVLLICVKGNGEDAPSPKGLKRNNTDDQPGNLTDTENPKLFLGSLTNHFLMPLASLRRLCGDLINGGPTDSDNSFESDSSDDCQGFSVYEPADRNPTSNLGSLIHQLNNHGIHIPAQYPNNNGNYGGGNSGGSYMGNNGGNYGGNGYGSHSGNYDSSSNNDNSDYDSSAHSSGENGNGHYGNNGYGNNYGHYGSNHHSYESSADGSNGNGNSYHGNNGGYHGNNGNGNNNGHYGSNHNGNYESTADSSNGNGYGYYGNNGGNHGSKPHHSSHTTVDVNVHVLSSFFEDPETRNILADYDETRLNDEDAAKKFSSSQNLHRRHPKCLHRGLEALRLLEAVKLTDEGRFLGFSPLIHCRPFLNALHESSMHRPF